MRYRLVAAALSVGLLLCGGLLWIISDALVYCRAVALGDLDGDGDIDAYVANGRSEDIEPDRIWLNDGRGGFRDGGQAGSGVNSRAAALGDVDADGDLDVLVGYTPFIEVLENTGNGRLTWQQQLGVTVDSGAWKWFVASGDLDGDADLDLYGAGCCGASLSFGDGRTRDLDPYNRVWLNDGAGRFVDSGQKLGVRASHAVSLGDLDGDGDLDAFVANGATSVGQANAVWLNDGRGRFADSDQSNQDPFVAGMLTYAVDLGDVDGDGDLDALVGNDGPNEIWLNDGSGWFGDSGQRLGDAETRLVRLADLDGDGDLDGFVANQTQAETWHNDGYGHFALHRQDVRYSPRHAVGLGDVDGDRDLDAVVGTGKRLPQVWLNDGSGRFSRRNRTWTWLGLATVLVAVCATGWWFLRRRRRVKAGEIERPG